MTDKTETTEAPERSVRVEGVVRQCATCDFWAINSRNYGYGNCAMNHADLTEYDSVCEHWKKDYA